ncbi:MAG: hypothetical protein AAF682_03815 [Planctomycetota bacterium]
MYLRATRARGGSLRRRGSALVSALVLGVILFGLVYATTLVSVVEVKDSRVSVDELRATYLAEAGVERAINTLNDAAQKNPFRPIDGLVAIFGGDDTIVPFVGEQVSTGGGHVGSYSVTLTQGDLTADTFAVTIESTGYLPDAPQALGPGQRTDHWASLEVTVQFSLVPSDVFNYAYFINNWGWLYANSLSCNGNAGSNGQFDMAGYGPTITGQPVYESVAYSGGAATLSGYRDDNNDGLADGNDGGIFSGWDIVGAQNVNGNGGNASNQHDFQEQVEMPNLSDLSVYEEKAVAAGSSISIGAVPVADEVVGDDPGEAENLYLVGTAANPIVLDGPVVAQGDVIISGYVTGQGSIYAGGNVYIPDSIEYVNPPTTTRPTGTTQADTEAWLTDNWDKDFLGLFARENIVAGDHTNYWWRRYVSGWLASSLNKSEEDAGEDGIPNTYAGRDGIVGTADDDVLEDDGAYTVDVYTDTDAALGLIPAGKNVGDAVPGSGEDIDGDGQYDATLTIENDIDLVNSLAPGLWEGNLPAGGVASYSSIASLYANNIDAVLYTNHAFCYVVFGGDTAKINGAIVSRNESIIYGTPDIEFNHDSRLLGGSSGMAGDMLPRTLADPVIVRWSTLDSDPNRYIVLP